MPTIDTPLLIAGQGPASLVVAKLVSGHGLPSLIVDHEPFEAQEPVVLDDDSLAVLEPHGVLGVLRPYATVQDPFTIQPLLFEQGLKHHCVVDMLVTVFDQMTPTGLQPEGTGLLGALSDGDGDGRWEVRADAFFDASEHRGYQPGELNEAIHAGAAFADRLLSTLD